MTFTIMARCQDSGKLGIASSTRSLAVGARVTPALPNKGVVAVMAIADKRLGMTALRLLDAGHKAPGVIDELVAVDLDHEYRVWFNQESRIYK